MSSSVSVMLVALLAAAWPAHAQTGGMARLFDGKSLSGWEGPGAMWRVVDGAIVGGTLERSIRQDEFLCTTAAFDNFELRVTARIKGNRNAGVSFRSLRVPGSNQVGGYQADMGFISGQVIARLSDTVPDDPERPYPLCGSLLDEYRPEASRYPNPGQPYRLIAVAPRETVERTLRPDDWNEIVVFAIGPRIRLQLNGVTTVEFVEKGNVPLSGRVCLQLHNGPPSELGTRRYRFGRCPCRVVEVSHLIVGTRHLPNGLCAKFDIWHPQTSEWRLTEHHPERIRVLSKGCAMWGAVRGADANLAEVRGEGVSAAEGVSARNCVTKHYAVTRE